MEFVILGLLIMRPLTAYDINNSFKQGISLFYSASYGSIQAALKKLLKKESATFEQFIENGRNKKLYTVTESGRESFFEWMFSDISETNNDSIVYAKLFFLGLVQEKKDKADIIRNIILLHEKQDCQLRETKKAAYEHDIPEEHVDIFTYNMKCLEHGMSATIHSKEFFEKILSELCDE